MSRVPKEEKINTDGERERERETDRRRGAAFPTRYASSYEHVHHQHPHRVECEAECISTACVRVDLKIEEICSTGKRGLRWRDTGGGARRERLRAWAGAR